MKENTVNPEVVNAEVGTEVTRMVINEPVSMMTPNELMNPKATEMYCSVQDDGSMKSKAKIYNMLNNPEKKIADIIGTTINMKDVLAHMIEVVNEQTGELMTVLRTVIIDDKGVSYEAVSQGVQNSLSRIMDIFGQPNTWEEPIPVTPVQKKTNNGNNKVTILKVEL